MPYIHVDQREELDKGEDPADAGELAYVLTREVVKYLNRRGKRYTTLAEINGVLDSVKFEFQRQVLAPYENDKRSTNGDVWDK